MMTELDERNEGSLPVLGRALGDPVRLALLELLVGGPAAVSDLVAATGQSQPNVSNHLGVLRDAGLVRQSREGRHVVYALRDATVAALVEAIGAFARPAGTATRVTPPLAAARTCYDHLAGRLGVAIFDRLVAKGALVVSAGVELEGKPRQLAARADASLGPAAAEMFGRLGIDLVVITGSRTGRPPARGRGRRISPICLDWTERRAHVGGAVGAAIWTRGVEAGWVVRQSGTRAVLVTPAGREAFAERLGVAAE